MTTALIGISCCLAMMGLLHGYLEITKKKYYDGHDQSSLSNTFYHTGWKFRVLLVVMPLLLIFPILLANGSYIDGAWSLTAQSVLTGWGKFVFALAMGGLIGVALNADFMSESEATPHVAAAAGVAALGAFAGCLMRNIWYVGLAIWLAWLGYYLYKQYKNKKAKNPDAFDLYLELVCFYSLPTCLIVFILLKLI